MRQLFVLCLAAVFTIGAMGEEEKDPWVKIAANVMVDGVFEAESTVVQKFPMGEEPMKAMLTLKAEPLGTEPLGEIKGYYLSEPVEDCAAWMPAGKTEEDGVYELFPEVADMNVSAADSMPSSNSSDMPSESSEFMKSREIDDNLFSFLDGQVIVVRNGEKYCSKISIKESEGMNMLEIKFSKGIDMNRMTLAWIISEKLDIDYKYILIGNTMADGDDCSSTKVFFNKKFDDKKMLQKVYMTFKSMYGLGVFSPTEKCQTDVKNSFIVTKILKMFAESDMSEKEPQPPMTTCAGISSRLAQEYKARLAKYDCIVAQYAKKYGVSMDGCASNSVQTDGQWGQNDREEQWGNDGNTIAPRCNCNSTTGVDPEFEMYYIQIMQALGAPLYNPEIDNTKAKLRKLVESSSPDATKIGMLVQEIQDMQKKQEEYYYKSGYGMCLVAGYGDMAMEKFKSIKEKIANGKEADAILKDLLVENMNWLIEMKKNSSSEEIDRSKMMDKMKLLLKMNKGCSKEADRKRVWEMLSNIKETAPQFLSEISEMIGVQEISGILEEIKTMIMEDSEEMATKIFLAVYADVEPKEDDPMAMKLADLATAFNKNFATIAGKIRNWMMDADVEKIMVGHILMLPDEYVQTGCDLKDFGEKVMSYMSDRTPSKPCDQSTDRQWMNQGYGQAQGMETNGYWQNNEWRMAAIQRGYYGRQDKKEEGYYGY